MTRRRRKSSVCTESKLLPEMSFDQSTALIRYAKCKKPETKCSVAVQTIALVSVLILSIGTYIYFDHFHWHLTNFMAEQWNDHHAQHVMGHKLLQDRTNLSGAFYWFRKSANQGHPHSAYNLAAGHLSGHQTDVRKGEVRQLLKFAAAHGVEEARHLLRTLCRDKPSYCNL